MGEEEIPHTSISEYFLFKIIKTAAKTSSTHPHGKPSSLLPYPSVVTLIISDT